MPIEIFTHISCIAVTIFAGHTHQHQSENSITCDDNAMQENRGISWNFFPVSQLNDF